LVTNASKGLGVVLTVASIAGAVVDVPGSSEFTAEVAGEGTFGLVLLVLDLSENSQPNHSKPLQLFMEILRSA